MRMTADKEALSYLTVGIYTINEAAKLIDVPYKRLWRWVHGDPNIPTLPPLIKNDLRPVDGQVVISFVNLIEALFISRFSNHGVHVRSIRAMAQEAQALIDNEHPFATDVVFKTDGKRIFAYIAKQFGDAALYDLKKHNWALEPILGRGLKAAVVYGPSGFANRWYPKKPIAPHIILNPVAAFGQPVLADSGIPTNTIHNAYLAEGKNINVVASWFMLPIARVIEAIRFETALAKAA